MATWCKFCHWGAMLLPVHLNKTTEVPMSWTAHCPKKHLVRFSIARSSPIRIGLPWEDEEDCPDYKNYRLTRFERVLLNDPVL